jgi:hypothetical protein
MTARDYWPILMSAILGIAVASAIIVAMVRA